MYSIYDAPGHTASIYFIEIECFAKIREQAERGTPGGRALSLGSLPKMYRLAKPIIIKPILRKASPKAGSSGM